MSSPRVLFRFLTAEAGTKSIEGRSLRLGRFGELNDPFEWRMGMTGYIPEGGHVVEACVERFLRDMNDSMGVLCFSDTASESVLWSHYADRHRGVCLQMELGPDEHLHDMHYTDERPWMDLNWLHGPDCDERIRPILEQLLRRKSKGWAYEREVRAIIDLKECTVSGGSYFRAIPRNYLKRVILGFRCPLSQSYVEQLLDQVGFSDVSVSRAKHHATSYVIQC